MRPKKVILLVGADSDRRSILSFLFSTHGYRVETAATAEEAVAFASDNVVSLVLASYALDAGVCVTHLKSVIPHVPAILLAEAQQLGEMHSADAMLNAKATTAAELLERVKIMSARKRGPVKGTFKKPPASVDAMMALAERRSA